MKKLFILMMIFGFILNVELSSQEKKTDSDIEKEKDIVKLLKISGTADFAFIIIDDVINNYKQFISNVPDGYWEDIKTKTDINPFIKSVVSVYEKRFSMDEIKQLIIFFESEVGHKWATSLEDMNEEVMTKANLFGQTVFTHINKKLIEDGYINKQGMDSTPSGEEEQQKEIK